MQKTYDLATAKALLELAYPEWEHPPYIIRDDGVHQSEEHREISPSEKAFDWAPAYDMAGPDAPDPMTAPMLPIPFNAAQLAAFMLDGAGGMIPESLECRIGANEPNLERVSHPRWRKVREALQNAFTMVAQAMQYVGPPNYEEGDRAHSLNVQYEDALDQAHKREGVSDHKVSENERRARYERAATSVLALKMVVKQAETEADENWKAWRRAMVHQLLEPEPIPEAKGDEDEDQAQADFLDGFASVADGRGLDAGDLVKYPSVTAKDAALVVCGINPHVHPDPEQDAPAGISLPTFRKVKSAFDSVAKDGQDRTLKDWVGVAAELCPQVEIDVRVVVALKTANRFGGGEQPVVSIAAESTKSDEEWKEKARQRALEIIARDKKNDRYGSQENIADEIAREFRDAGVVGAGGKPLAGSYIKRHALTGISSATNRQRSMQNRQGK